MVKGGPIAVPLSYSRIRIRDRSGVARRVAAGLSDEEIAAPVTVSENAVRTHPSRPFD